MADPDIVYLDNHATTRIDPRVLEAMLPLLGDAFGNPHSTTHELGRRAAQGVQRDLETIARCLGCRAEEIIVTSGATESTNLAITGLLTHPRQRRRRIVTVATEHPAVLDPIHRHEREGFEVVRLPVKRHDAPDAGALDLDALAAALDERVAIVSVMWANNEIGVIHKMDQIAALCHAHGAALHCDATQAVGRLPVDIARSGIDLFSCSAHKFHGPKGVGMLILPRTDRRVRLRPLLAGGGQQHGLRPGTMNPAAIRGMATALKIATEEMESATPRICQLRDSLWSQLQSRAPGVELNGPAPAEDRLPGNLNVCFRGVDGETLMMQTPSIAVSSGSACSSVDPRPSHVLLEIGRSEHDARASIRFGLSRFTTQAEIDTAAEQMSTAYRTLREGVA